MKVLGIESTAHTFSIGITEGGKVLSNVIDTYSGGGEGLIPRKMADHHAAVFASVLEKSLTSAKTNLASGTIPGAKSVTANTISGARVLAQNPASAKTNNVRAIGMANIANTTYGSEILAQTPASAKTNRLSGTTSNAKSDVANTISGAKIIAKSLASAKTNTLPGPITGANSDAINLADIDLIAFSQGPGIGAPLSVGISGAKYLALKYGKPLIGVNHCYAHVKISEHMCGAEKPLIIYLSGGNSQILAEGEGGHYHVMGETLDVGIGNLFDSFARAIGMKEAHGAALAKLAEGGRYVELPYSVKGMNLVFSGIQTAAEKAAKSHPHRDVAYSLMETAFAMTCEVTERALFLSRKKSLVVCGGVAQNKRLQAMLAMMCDADGVRFGVAPDEFNRDNGAMIAYAGSLLYKKYGAMPTEKCVPITNYRIDRMKDVLG